MNKHTIKMYNVIIVILALFSIVLAISDFSKTINLDESPWLEMDNGILLIFTADYFIRLFLSNDKWDFFKHNVFDLLAILPFYSIFSFFRFARILRLIRVARAFRFIRFVGFIGKIQKYSHDILKTNGFIYLVWTSLATLLLSTTLYALAENVSWGESLWWAITTATTVGYGDISPHTVIGKIAAILLMFIGIGFIGSLTSTMTTFFTKKDSDDRLNKIFKTLKHIESENITLKLEMKDLENQLKKGSKNSSR